jgi:Zn-dependent M28 family amino/carboxypeptidase
LGTMAKTKPIASFMKRFLLTAFVVLLANYGFGQDNDPIRKYSALIKPEELKDNLTILASDALEGRMTGTRGQKMAAAFIANHFREIGLQGPVNGSYYQPVPLYKVALGDVYVTGGGQTAKNFTDMFYYGDEDTQGEVKVDVVFAGQGREEDFAQVDVKGKAVVLLITKMDFQTMRQFRTTMTKAKEKGARFVFAASVGTDEEFSATANRIKGFAGGGELTLEKPGTKTEGGAFFMKGSLAAKILNTTVDKLKTAANAEAKKQALKKVKLATASLQIVQQVTEVPSENILGYLPGTDKKDELVIVTAHFDHIGKEDGGEGDIINNGADDDGSGTVAVMQIAKAFTEARKHGNGPRRSMLFMTVTGEEEGLFGSEYYVTNPVFPLANTVVDLNIDMIGRTDPKNEANKNYVYVIGADKLSSELHNINEQLNKTYTQLKFDYVYNDESHPERLYYRSDHWNFAKNNIPIIFYFDGIHEDYHKVSDEVSKIDFDLLTLRTRCVFNVAWEVANREERLKLDKK